MLLRLELFLHFVCAVAAIFLNSCSRRTDAGDVIQARPLVYYHKVVKNESLGDIAKRYDMSMKEICRLNGISASTVLVPGQRIFILPTAHTQSKSPTISINETYSDSNHNIVENVTPDQENEQEEYLFPERAGSEFIWPVKGRVLRHFKDVLPNGTSNEGINISAPLNVAVRACADGDVVDVGELVVGFGKMIILSHDNGMISIYGHLQEIALNRPTSGERVRVTQGQVIGRVGKTGNVRVPQLHFQLRNQQKQPVNPIKCLPKEESALDENS
jgi:murein DD-endopeptidase MepM/ murein hydrolase activator NlpD